jgi:hypothetical protein
MTVSLCHFAPHRVTQHALHHTASGRPSTSGSRRVRRLVAPRLTGSVPGLTATIDGEPQAQRAAASVAVVPGLMISGRA